MSAKENETNQEKRSKFSLKLAAVVGSTVFAILLLSGLVAIHFVYAGKTLPNQSFAGIELGGLDTEVAEQKISERWRSLPTSSIAITYEQTTASLTYADLGVQFTDIAPTLNSLAVYPDNASYTDLLGNLALGKRLPIQTVISQQKTEPIVLDTLPGIKAAEDADLIYDDGLWTIKPEVGGVGLEWDQFTADLMASLQTPANTKAAFTFMVQPAKPAIAAEDIEASKEDLIAILDRSIRLFGPDSLRYDIDWRVANRDLVDLVNEGGVVKLKLNPANWAHYVSTTLEPEIEKTAEGLTIDYNTAQARAEFSGTGTLGREMLTELLTEKVAESLASLDSGTELTIPTEFTSGPLTIAPELKAMGITDLVAVGDTTYYGSPANRMHNIAVGVERYNGLIVPAGSTFSFNEELGPVEASTGYKPELVIKADGTYPEYGGGLCQVSTTLYRAVLNADLEVTQRRPHSYAVSYYAQRLGHGLDATIYPGSQDLQFVNSTPGALVIQSYTDGAAAYFKLYGTPNNIAEVTYDGPYETNYRAPGAAVEIYDPSLEPGARVQVEKPHTGFDVTWYKKITYKDGTTETKEIFSQYRAVPAKFRVGPVPTTGEDTPIEPLFEEPALDA